MEIKKVEKLLNISRSNIRFYEKEGLINPSREDNNYRDYSEEDIAMLKKIIVLRKLGFTVDEIKKLQKGDVDFSEVAIQNNTRLQTELKDLKKAIELSDYISKNEQDFNSFDTEQYWHSINDSEKSGEKFVDIYKDCLVFESEIFDTMWRNVFLHDSKKSRYKHGLVKSGAILLFLCVIRGLAKMFWGNGSFLEGFLYPFFIFVIASAILLPLFLLSKKSPKLAKIIIEIIVILGALILLAVVGLLLFAGFTFLYDVIKSL